MNQKERLQQNLLLRPKIYFYLTDDDKNPKKGKGTNQCVIASIINT